MKVTIITADWTKEYSEGVRGINLEIDNTRISITPEDEGFTVYESGGRELLVIPKSSRSIEVYTSFSEG